MTFTIKFELDEAKGIKNISLVTQKSSNLSNSDNFLDKIFSRSELYGIFKLLSIEILKAIKNRSSKYETKYLQAQNQRKNSDNFLSM